MLPSLNCVRSVLYRVLFLLFTQFFFDSIHLQTGPGGRSDRLGKSIGLSIGFLLLRHSSPWFPRSGADNFSFPWNSERLFPPPPPPPRRRRRRRRFFSFSLRFRSSTWPKLKVVFAIEPKPHALRAVYRVVPSLCLIEPTFLAFTEFHRVHDWNEWLVVWVYLVLLDFTGFT